MNPLLLPIRGYSLTVKHWFPSMSFKTRLQVLACKVAKKIWLSLFLLCWSYELLQVVVNLFYLYCL